MGNIKGGYACGYSLSNFIVPANSDYMAISLFLRFVTDQRIKIDD